MKVLLERLSRQLQLDKPLAYAVVARMWQALSGPLTMVFLFRTLTLPERGVYYTLVNVLGIQMFFELGLLNILISEAGGMAAALPSRSGSLRMRSLVASAQRWFGIAGILFALTAAVVGTISLMGKPAITNWQLPLLALVLTAGATVSLSPRVAILEGVGYREDVYRVRLYQMLTGSLTVWIALAAGFGLWALVLSAAAQLLWTAYLPLMRHATFFQRIEHTAPAPHDDAGRAARGEQGLAEDQAESDFSWARDVIPIQWRFAMISAANHLATQMFTVIVMSFHTASEAGRLGMTLSLSGAIQLLASAWVATKYSLISARHGAGEREAAGTLWRQTALVSTAILILGFAVGTLLLALLPLLGLGVEQGFIAPWQFIALAAGCVATHLVALQGFYVLAQRARPLLFASLVGLGSIAAAVWLGGKFYSITGIVCGYAAASWLVALPLHSWAYLAFRRETRHRPQVAT